MNDLKNLGFVTPDHNHWTMTSREWAAVLGAALGAFMAILDIQITNASLRDIQGALSLDYSEGGWISTSYLIAEIIVIPMTGYLSEVFGMRTYVTVNSALFIFASVLCGLSWNLQSMITFRLFQGFVGGTLIPMAFQIMILMMPRDRKPIGMAIFGFTATMAPTLGPALGGWLTDHYGWRLNFFINVIPGLVMIGAVMYGLPREQIDFKKLREIDLMSLLLLIFGLGPLIYVLEEGAKVSWFEDPLIQIGSLVSLGSLSLFIVRQLIRKNPLLNLYVLRHRNFAIASVITMVSGAALYGGIYSLSLYLGQIQNYSASEIGSVMMWVGIPQIAIMPFLPFLMKRFDLRLLAAVGMILFAGSNFLNIHLSSDYAGAQFRISLIIRAIGQPLFMIPLSTLGIALISPEETASASSIFNMLRNLGGSIGIALAGTFVISRQNLHFDQLEENLSLTNPLLTEKLSALELAFRSKGFDIVSAKMLALKTIVNFAQRESLIESFSDIFAVLSVGLVGCLLLILLVKYVSGQNHIEIE